LFAFIEHFIWPRLKRGAGLIYPFVCLQTDTGNHKRSALYSQNNCAFMTNKLSTFEISSAFQPMELSL